jgi:hypothetical protein
MIKQDSVYISILLIVMGNFKISYHLEDLIPMLITANIYISIFVMVTAKRAMVFLQNKSVAKIISKLPE